MSAGELLLVIGSLAVAAIGVRAALRTGGRPPVPPSEVSVPEFGLAGMFPESGYRAAHAVPFGPVQIEGTPLAQTAFDRSWNDWGRGERHVTYGSHHGCVCGEHADAAAHAPTGGDERCECDSHSGVGDDLWQCDACGEVIRYVDDPNGKVTLTTLHPYSNRRVRVEMVTPGTRPGNRGWWS